MRDFGEGESEDSIKGKTQLEKAASGLYTVIYIFI